MHFGTARKVQALSGARRSLQNRLALPLAGGSPSASGAAPSRDGEPPSASRAAPSRDGEPPSASGAVPSRDGEPPSVSGAAPSRDGESPSASGAAPSRAGEPPSASGAAPSRDGESPSASGAAPSRDGEPPSASERLRPGMESLRLRLSGSVPGWRASVCVRSGSIPGRRASVCVRSGSVRERAGHAPSRWNDDLAAPRFAGIPGAPKESRRVAWGVSPRKEPSLLSQAPKGRRQFIAPPQAAVAPLGLMRSWNRHLGLTPQATRRCPLWGNFQDWARCV